MKKTPTVYVVDDDPAFRQSAESLLQTAGLPFESFESAESFLQHVPPDAPGCLVLDHFLPGVTGLELLPAMRDRHFTLPVLMVSGTDSVPVAVAGMKLGLFDYLVKPPDPDALLSRIRSALDLDAQRRSAAAQLDDIRARFATLTAREQELLDLIVRGLPNKNIATQLGISIKTVETHRGSLMAKTGASNVADLVRMKMLVTENTPPPASPPPHPN